MRINQNIAAFNAYRNLSATQNAQSKSLEKLSSGFRINRAADDAAGLVISEGLRSQIGGLKQAARNAQDGISVVQTAEGALTEVHSMLQRMRDLAVQSANDSNNSESRAAAQAEIDQLTAEIDRIAETTQFGQVKLLDGSFGQQNAEAITTTTVDGATSKFGAGSANEGEFALQVQNATAGDDVLATVDGVNIVESDFDGYVTQLDGTAALTTDTNAGYVTAENFQQVVANKLGDDYAVSVKQATVDSNDVATYEVSVENLNGESFDITGTAAPGDNYFTDATYSASGSDAVFQVGANAGETIEFSITGMSAANLQVSSVDVSTQDGAESAITKLDGAIGDVSEQRGDLGAIQNRFEHTIANLQVTSENLQASESRIRDTDMAQEMVNFTRTQILQQAGTAMLAQANQIPQSVLSLLR